MSSNTLIARRVAIPPQENSLSLQHEKARLEHLADIAARRGLALLGTKAFRVTDYETIVQRSHEAGHLLLHEELLAFRPVVHFFSSFVDHVLAGKSSDMALDAAESFLRCHGSGDTASGHLADSHAAQDDRQVGRQSALR